MLDNPYLKHRAEDSLKSIIASGEVLDAALEAYLDAHPDMQPDETYLSDYHTFFEQAVDTIITNMLAVRHPDNSLGPETRITEIVAAFVDKHCAQERDVFMEDLRVLCIEIERSFRDTQRRGDFVDGTGDKFLAVCETHKIQPWKEA